MRLPGGEREEKRRAQESTGRSTGVVRRAHERGDNRRGEERRGQDRRGEVSRAEQSREREESTAMEKTG